VAYKGEARRGFSATAECLVL